MNREELKECVKWLRKAISVVDSVTLDKHYLIGSNVKVIFDALVVYEQLLSLPTRTLETLEVGDIVTFIYTDVNTLNWDNSDSNYSKTTLYLYDEDEFEYFRKECIIGRIVVLEIIPREAIELLKEVMK